MARFAVRFRLSIGHYGLAVTFHLFDGNGTKIRKMLSPAAFDVADQESCPAGRERADISEVREPYLCGYIEMLGATPPGTG